MIDTNQLLLLMNKNYRKNYKEAFNLPENKVVIKKDKRESMVLIFFQIFIVAFAFSFWLVNFFNIIFNSNHIPDILESFLEYNSIFNYNQNMFLLTLFFLILFILMIKPEKTSLYLSLQKQRKALSLSIKNKHKFSSNEKIKISFLIDGKKNNMELTIDEIIIKLEKLIFNNEIIEKFSNSVLIELKKELKKKSDEENKGKKDQQKEQQKIERSQYKKMSKKFLEELLEKEK